MFYTLFIAFKLREASSSLYPPDKKNIAGTAPKTDLLKVITVISATYYGLVLSVFYLPLVIILGFNTIPSRHTPNSYKA